MVTLVATANERVSEWQLRRWRRDTLSAYGARSFPRNRVYSPSFALAVWHVFVAPM